MIRVDRRRATTLGQLDDERAEASARRRMMTSSCALLGVAPFAHALAPHFVPALVRGLSAIWSAMTCTLLAVSVEELLLWRQRRRWLSRRRRLYEME